jgi:hypothetical protein
LPGGRVIKESGAARKLDTMMRMKQLLFLLSGFAGMAVAADLATVQNVYVLPMAKGFDQYLANRLFGGRLFQVVTDPKLADAVFTDRLGEAFQFQLETISPSPEAAEEEKKEEKKEGKKDDAAAASGLGGLGAIIGGQTVNKVSNPALNSSFGRAKGTVFLVDAKSRQVLWSVYEPPKNTSSKELDHTAGDIVSRLKKEMGKKK